MNLSGLKAKHWSELSGVGFLLVGNGAPPIERMLMKELHTVMSRPAWKVNEIHKLKLKLFEIFKL